MSGRTTVITCGHHCSLSQANVRRVLQFESDFLASHLEIPLFSPCVQPVVAVAYVLVAVMHIVLGLSLRDCSQLLFTMKLLINLMVEDFRTTNSQGKFLAKSIPSDARTVLRRLALQLSHVTNQCPVL